LSPFKRELPELSIWWPVIPVERMWHGGHAAVALGYKPSKPVIASIAVIVNSASKSAKSLNWWRVR
jgi:hypothetical protein